MRKPTWFIRRSNNKFASNKILGINNGHFEFKNKNIGTIIRGSIKEFIQQYQESKRNNYLTLEHYNTLKEALKLEKPDHIENSIGLIESINEINNGYYTDAITLIYKVDHNKTKLSLFHFDFVQSNKKSSNNHKWNIY